MSLWKAVKGGTDRWFRKLREVADYECFSDGNRLSEIFKCEMNKWGPVSMGFQEYRQLANLWMRTHLKRVELEEDLRDHSYRFEKD